MNINYKHYLCVSNKKSPFVWQCHSPDYNISDHVIRANKFNSKDYNTFHIPVTSWGIDKIDDFRCNLKLLGVIYRHFSITNVKK